MSIPNEADAGFPVNEIWHKYRISSATYHKWKAEYSGLEASEINRPRELEYENGRLKQMYAELSLDHQLLKELLEKKL